MAGTKTSAISPVINSQQQTPSPEGEERIFEDKYSEMAYNAFSSRYPSLVESIVTFKILDSDIEKGSAVGAFIIETNGEYLYVPAVLAGNHLKPFDIVYVKSKDMFMPLTDEWLDEIKKTSLSELGEGTDLPDTVATDVDIRNVVVPPTTGRYSYASVDVSPRNRLAAEATQPLGQRLAKIAQDPFSGANPGSGEGGGGGGDSSSFNPELWAMFVEQFQRIQGTTPGQALDQGIMDIDSLAKMYKSHTKTWETVGSLPAAGQQNAPNMPPAQEIQESQDQAPGMEMSPQMPYAGMPKTGSIAGKVDDAVRAVGRSADEAAEGASKNVEDIHEPLGQMLDRYLGYAGRGAGAGALTGGIYAGYDAELADVPSAALRGAIGGAALGVPARAVARGAVASKFPNANLATVGKGGVLGGGALGGFLMARSDPRSVSRWTAPSQATLQEYYEQHPDMYRTASVNPEQGLQDMLKHAKESTSHKNKLPEFLSAAPDTVKTAFINVLDANPKLLKAAADIYGKDTLIESLTFRKQAGKLNSSGGALYIADETTDPSELHSSFGDAAPEAFNGILLRGYYFKDSRPSLNLAIQTQESRNFQEAKDAGVYLLYNTEGNPKPALVLVNPVDLLDTDREFFPPDETKVQPPEVTIPATTENREPDAVGEAGMDPADLGDVVHRSHSGYKLALLGDGRYVYSTRLMGEQTTEGALKGTAIFKKVMSDNKATPTAGEGVFAAKKGTSYVGTMPVEISNITTNNDGVVRGKIKSVGGSRAKNFVIDPRSPINKVMRPKNSDMVIIPASWKWVPVKKSVESDEFLNTPKQLCDLTVDALQSMGSHEAVARKAGQSMYAVDGGPALSKKEALHKLASDHYIPASDAEAMLKVADHENLCKAHIVSYPALKKLAGSIKLAQGMAAPQSQMGPPAAMTGAPPAPQGPDPSAAVEEAFNQTVTELQQAIENLQGQLSVLLTVQQRAMALQGQAPTGAPMQGPPAPGAVTQAPPAAGPPAGPPGGQPMGPAAQMEGPPMQQGAPQGAPPGAPPGAPQGAPPLPVLRTEQPSAEELSQQLNPAFLEQAAELQETGAFDAGTIASLSKDPSMRDAGSQYAASLEGSIDDIGRTLLTLYLQESELKERIGNEAYTDLEEKLRNTFKGLGELVLSVTENTSMLHENEAA